MKSNEFILKEVYPLISTSLVKNTNKLKQVIAKYIETHSKEIMDIAPFSIIYFGAEDINSFFKALGITEKQVGDVIAKTYYYQIPSFNPRAALDPFTIALLTCIRYFHMKKMKKEMELATIYLAFSGKYYPSIHHGSFPKFQPEEYRHIMIYTVNNKLSSKFDLKREGSVFGAIKSISKTWLDTYSDKLTNYDDEDVVYLVQQLHNRIKSFMKNIAEVYYETYEAKENYFTYDSDNLNDNSYHIADNDSLKIEKATENTLTKINSSAIDYSITKMASDSNIKTDEVKSIIESIISNNDNIPEIKELVRLIITEYYINSKTKDIKDVDFITTSITPKPNTKDPGVLRSKAIVEGWLDENSSNYRRRKSRAATKSSYNKSVITYFVLLIYRSNK